jgi:uncharacterized protein (DUF488 family)
VNHSVHTQLFTIGYQHRAVAELIATLHKERVATLVDVRLTPLSRKPGFSASALRSAAEGAGLRYA